MRPGNGRSRYGLPRRQERPCSCPEGGSTCHRVVFYLLTSAATAYAEGVWVLWEGWFSEGAGDSWAALGSDVSQSAQRPSVFSSASSRQILQTCFAIFPLLLRKLRLTLGTMVPPLKTLEKRVPGAPTIPTS